MTGRVIAVSVSEEKGTKKKNVPSITLVDGVGVLGDAHAGPGDRQISILLLESIQKMKDLGLDVSPGDFAENITLEGVHHLSVRVGTVIHLGESVELEVTVIGKTCHERCNIFYTVGDCVMPREGIFARVVSGGVVRPGDSVALS